MKATQEAAAGRFLREFEEAVADAKDARVEREKPQE